MEGGFIRHRLYLLVPHYLITTLNPICKIEIESILLLMIINRPERD